MSMVYWWNADNYGNDQKRKKLPQCCFVHHKSYTDQWQNEHGPMKKKAGNKPPELWHDTLQSSS
jgi:hypothetical protein